PEAPLSPGSALARGDPPVSAPDPAGREGTRRGGEGDARRDATSVPECTGGILSELCARTEGQGLPRPTDHAWPRRGRGRRRPRYPLRVHRRDTGRRIDPIDDLREGDSHGNRSDRADPR